MNQAIPIAHVHAAVKANQLVARNTAHLAAVTAHAAALQAKNDASIALVNAQQNDVQLQQAKNAAISNQKALLRRASKAQLASIANAQIHGHVHAVLQAAKNTAAHPSTVKAVAGQQKFSAIMLSK